MADEWFYLDVFERQPKGPISVRDIDVLMRTNSIDSNTYVWREGMEDWLRIFQVEELKDIVSTTHTEIQESLIKNKIQTVYATFGKGESASNNSIDNFFFGADGFWHVYNPITKVWTIQENKPNNRRKSVDLEEEKKLEENQTNEQKEPDIVISQMPDKENEDLTPKEFLGKKRNNEQSEISEISLVNETSVPKTEDEIKKIAKRKKKAEKQKEKKRQQWYLPKVNSNVYVKGLPKDVTENELFTYFSRCGFIRKDERTGELKIKIYKDNSNKPKGDALISFLREESVTMAIDMLNDTEIRPGNLIIVERAQFEQKGSYKPRDIRKTDNIHRYKMKTDVDRMLGWNEEDDEKGLKIVVLKNLFDPREFAEDPGLRNDLEIDIQEECESNFGMIDRFMIFEEHPEGVVKIKFKTPLAAEKCIENLNHRYYNGKLIEASYWDGKTDYNKFHEDSESINKRVQEFGNWLEN
jgi:HIV Tat-specific factor 1